MVIDGNYFVCAWLTADFLSGVVHWWEDRYGDPQWPVIGPHVIEPNIVHHTNQMAFTLGTYWQRNWTSIVPALSLSAIAYLFGYEFLAVVFVMLSQANEIHAWSHQKCSRRVRGLQLLGLLQSPEQHALHHRRPFDTNYCVMTDLLNPALSRCGFWPAIEEIVRRLSGVSPRVERESA